MIDLPNDADIVGRMLFEPDKRLLVIGPGQGFHHQSRGCLGPNPQRQADPQSGRWRQEGAFFCRSGDAVAIIGQNLLTSGLHGGEIPEMARGRGVLPAATLPRWRDLRHQVLYLADGLCWRIGDKARREMDLMAWLGRRASVGRTPPTGFPRHNKFT